MTIREAIAQLLVAVAGRIDPPEVTDDIVTAPLALGGSTLSWPSRWPQNPTQPYPTGATTSRCPACGSWFTGTHVCHTVFPTTTCTAN